MEKTRIIFTKTLWVLLLASITQFGYSNAVDTPISEIEYGETLACNDSVNISVDTDCIATVTPDQILEGNGYIYDNFTVTVYDNDGNEINTPLSSDYVGTTLIAEVTDNTPFGNNGSCQSHITIVDKVGPPLSCSDIYTTCYGDLTPGSTLPKNFKFSFKPESNLQIPDHDTLVYSLVVGNIPNGKVYDLDVVLDITHDNNSELASFLVSPEGDTVWLFKDLKCSLPGFHVRFDDEAKKTSGQFTNDCSDCCPDQPGVKGRYKPLKNLYSIDGSYLTGEWKIGIVDKKTGRKGKLNNVELLFQQQHGKITFPIPATASNPIKIGKNKYKVENGVDACGSTILFYKDTIITKDCQSEYNEIVERKWKAIDESGNANYCTQKIYVVRTGTSFLKFPANYDGIDQNVLSCSNQNVNTGKPESELCEEITATFTDDTIKECGGSYKIYRNWKVSAECSSDVLEHVQVIVFMDDERPEIANAEDITTSTNGLECSKDINIKFPEVNDECSGDSPIDLSVSYQKLDINGVPTTELLTDDMQQVSYGNFVFHANVGKYRITYTATDICGNSATSTSTVTVRDDSPPVAVCQEHTQVSINLIGEAKVKASSFDDGSHDNCSEVTLKVRRKNSVCNNLDQTFRDTISFCCEDVNTTQLVELLVSDGTNTNTCIVEVNIVDKLGPKITCPNDTTITCSENYEQLFGTATAYDNCGTKEITTELTTNTIGQCNTGYVIRKWAVEDKQGLSDVCYQRITVVDLNSFNGSDIIWPLNKDFTNCVENFEPAITGTVTFKNEDFCSMVAARYEDEVFNVVDGACLKILRHWEVIDWCHYDKDPKNSIWTHTQVIKLNNTKAPQFDETCSNKTFKTYGDCEGVVEYEKNASDDCTDKDELNWEYYIDTNLDGIWDIGPVHSNKINRVFKNGTYKVAWSVEDGCGNKSTCEETLYVKDGKKPTPLCITKLTTAVMDELGTVTICAEKFNLGPNCDNCPTGSYDNCTPSNKLVYSFSEDVNDRCRTYTCDSLPNGEFVYKTLNMYVTDEAGNSDFCTVLIKIEDNEANACDDSTGVEKPLISGLVYDPDYNKMKNVKMSLSSSEGEAYSVVTDKTGVYSFNDIDTETNFELEGEYNSNCIDGVSTLDIVLIQKHILGISNFNTPDKFIAADVNFSKSITAADILLIRKAILGIEDDFGKKGRSWAFTADNDNYRNANNILHSWESSISISGNTQNQEQNWIGIKMGDINGSIYGKLESRSDNKALLFTKEMSYKANEEIEVPFTFENINKISGGQFTLNFDLNKLTFVKIIPNEKLITRNSFGLNRVEKGALTLSWVKPDITINDSDILFTIVFQANSDSYLSQAISIGDNVTKSEAYNNKFEVMDIELQMREGNDYSVTKLYGNNPNPFTGKTNISFELPANQKVELKFYDITGKLINNISEYFSKGYNSVNVSFGNNANGVIYCKMETNEFTKTIKMVNIK